MNASSEELTAKPRKKSLPPLRKRQEWAESDCSQPDVPQPPGEGVQLHEAVPHEPWRSDVANADRLVKKHDKRIRYCQGVGWLYYIGTHWLTNAEDDVTELAKDTVRDFYREAQLEQDCDKKKRMMAAALSSESAHRIRAMVQMAQSIPKIRVSGDKLDGNPMLLNLLNGTLDLESGSLRVHRPEDLITKCCPIDYVPGASCPTWDKFIRQVAKNDGELVQFIRRMAGYCLTGDTSEQVLFLLYGPGANGKSVFVRVQKALLGPYALQISPDALMAKSTGAPNPELARLAGARLALASESDDGRQFSESLIKQVTGGERIVARHLYKGPFEFQPEFKLVFSTNHKPVIRGTDHAIWRRILLIPFSVTIPPENRDPRLFAKLERELPGILNWAVAGYSQWRCKGLQPPSVVSAATKQYQTEQDDLAHFLESCCEQVPRHQYPVGDLYALYEKWSATQSDEPFSKRAFGARLSEKGVEQKRTGKYRYWVGIRPKPQPSAIRKMGPLRRPDKK